MSCKGDERRVAGEVWVARRMEEPAEATLFDNADKHRCNHKYERQNWREEEADPRKRLHNDYECLCAGESV